MALLGIPDETRAKWMKIKSYYIITREYLMRIIIYDHLSRMTTVDEIINANALKIPRNAKMSMITLAAKAMLTECKRNRGALALET